MRRGKLIGVLLGALSFVTAGGVSLASSGEPVEITMWSPQAGAGPDETHNMETLVSDFNASQDDYEVVWEAFPFDSYASTVQGAATAGELPCILAVDQPVVPSWVWAGYLAPLNLPEDLTNSLVPGARGDYDGQLYSVGYWDAVLSMMARQSVLEAHGIRIPTIDNPWTRDEFDAALAELKASGEFEYPLLLGNPTGVGASYPFATFLWSFGGDMINRDDFQSADGVLNGPEAVAFGEWLQGLADDGMISKSPSDGNPFLDGNVAITFDGNWNATAVIEAFGDDVLFLPPPDFGAGIRVGAGSIGFGVSTSCSDEQKAGAEAYLAMSLDPEYVVRFADTQGVVPATPEAASLSRDYAEGGRLEIFAELLQNHSQTRPPTPAFPAIAVIFDKAVGDIIAGADVQSALDNAVAEIDRNIEENGGYASQ